MAALIGILLDVSDSMKHNTSGLGHERLAGQVRQRSWSQSIVWVVDQLVKNDVSSENQVFALCYGAKCEPVVFDLLDVVQLASGYSQRSVSLFENENFLPDKNEILDEILGILERNGADYVREWASVDKLASRLSKEEATIFLKMFRENTNDFTERFVQNCLPEACRSRSSSWSATVAEKRNMAMFVPIFGGFICNAIEKKAEDSTNESVKEAVEKGMNLIKEIIWFDIAKGITLKAIVDVHKASEILHGCVDKKYLTDDELEALLKNVEPFIYGDTPMIAALCEAKKLMSSVQHQQHKKVLFVVSDGNPTDVDTKTETFSDWLTRGMFAGVRDASDMSSLGVHIVSCYITGYHIAEPRRLYSSKRQDWDKGAKFMFDLSSCIKTQLLPRSIFVKQGWQIDIENNETRLFLQVNHPDLIDEVCKFARDIVCSQDALSDILSSIDLDLYINKVNDGFEAKEQVGGTCYANASAAVIHLATKRIFGRYGGYPEFFDLRDQLIAKYEGDVCGANTLRVLKEVCPKYRLHCRKVDAKGALEAVAAKQPVIARFRLTDSEWDIFRAFYGTTPAGTLSKRDLDISKRHPGSETGGHAVVLTGFNSRGLILMNSWGTDWANNGFFSVENADVLGLEFVDVYWALDDLKDSEIEAYKQEGPRISQKLISSLKGLQTAEYKCPLCHESSLVREFRGKLVKATCPKCHDEFNTGRGDTHDLVLNMYLTALSFSG